jgi:hypothetical protein
MRETKLWSRLEPHFKHWGEFSRVENAIEPGMWDIHYCIDGQLGWLETKIVHSNLLYFEKFQLPWGRRYWRTGATNMFVIAGFEGLSGLMYIYHVKEITSAPKTLDRKFVVINIEDINPQISLEKPYNWEVLRQLLSDPFTITNR